MTVTATLRWSKGGESFEKQVEGEHTSHAITLAVRHAYTVSAHGRMEIESEGEVVKVYDTRIERQGQKVGCDECHVMGYWHRPDCLKLPA